MPAFKNKIYLSPPYMGGTEQKYIQKAFDENWIVPLGPNVTDFEQVMKDYIGLDNTKKPIFATAMISGTAALHIALKLLNIQPNQEVFCSSLTFIASCNPILYEKAKPIFIDSEINTWNICPDSLEQCILTRIKKNLTIPSILIAVDLYGISADYSRILPICQKYNIKIIEDSAEALGSTFQNQKCGTFGDYSILSFNGNKIITTSGGGMLLTKSPEDAQKALFLITQAKEKAPYYLHKEVGYNYRLSNISAGIGLGQMEILNKKIEKRKNINEWYKKYLKKNDWISFPQLGDSHQPNFWLTTTRISKNAPKSVTHILKDLENENIEARHIWKPMHTQPLFKNCEYYSINNNNNSEKIFEEGICLPSGDQLIEEDIKIICSIIEK